MEQLIAPPPVVHQNYLSTMPSEILDEIFGYILPIQANDQQVLPNPYMRVSKTVGQHVIGMLTKHCTLQVECRHPTSHHFWATSMYRSKAKGEYLHTPRLPTIKGSLVRWSRFRHLVLCAEMLGNVDSIYIKFSWLREMAFTILFADHQPPIIKTHTWFRSRNPPSPPRLRPDLVRWTQQPAICSAAWIEAFIDDVRNQCDAHLAQHSISREHYLYKATLREMTRRQPWKKYAVVLRPVDLYDNKPMMLRLGEAHSLRSAFISQNDLRHKAELEREKELDERFERSQLLNKRGRSNSVPARAQPSGTRVRSTSV